MKLARVERTCLFDTTQVSDNRWRHDCVKCRKVRITSRPNHVAECRLWRQGFGSRLGQMLKMVGVTPGRISKLIGRPCGCIERGAKLDRMDFALRNRLKKMGLKIPELAVPKMTFAETNTRRKE